MAQRGSVGLPEKRCQTSGEELAAQWELGLQDGGPAGSSTPESFLETPRFPSSSVVTHRFDFCRTHPQAELMGLNLSVLHAYRGSYRVCYHCLLSRTSRWFIGYDSDSTAGGTGSIPSQRIKIPAVQKGNCTKQMLKKKKKVCLRRNMDVRADHKEG